MELQEFLAHVDGGAPGRRRVEHHRFMHDAAQEAFRLTAELNATYRTPEQVRDIISRLTGTVVDESVTVFPPFHSEFGKNLHLGKDVFINLGCRFQDTGGITIGDGTLIGHGSTLTTLNHAIDPARRADMRPAPDRHRTPRLARRGGHGRPRGHHRRRRRHRRGFRRHQGRRSRHHRGGCPGAAHPRDRLRHGTRAVTGRTRAVSRRCRRRGVAGR